MARANRHHIPGYIWHITHRCHNKAFLLKFEKDKRQWVRWLFEAKKRYGLCIFNYTVTSNHVHLLVYDENPDVIPKSIQLIAGRVGREYNRRKNRKGAFWEDRYHATAVHTGEHLIRCLAYIDLNMVRAGVVEHPIEWKYGGYHEIQHSRKRYSLIHRKKLAALLGLANHDRLPEYHSQWLEGLLAKGSNGRDPRWTESIAVGDKEFVEDTKSKLGIKAMGRKISGENDDFELREDQSPYNYVFTDEKDILRTKNSYLWKIY